jgi:hypothetical protein
MVVDLSVHKAHNHQCMYPVPLPETFFGDQDQESVVTDDDQEYDDSEQDEDCTFGSPAGELEV